MSEALKFEQIAVVIQERLGKAAHSGPNHLLFEGDCVHLMDRLAGIEFADLTITSPPYNIGKEYEAVRESHEYIAWCSRWIDALFGLTASNGAFWLNLGYFSLPDRAKAIPIPYLLWDRVPFFLLQEIVWQYGAGVAARHTFSPRNEKFLWYVKDHDSYTFNLDAVRDPNVKYPNQRKNGKLKCNPLGKNPGDVWHFPKVTSGAKRSSKERTPHPAQFPIAVIDRIVKACSNRHDVLFDPFAGSGTVLESAIRNGRFAVGFELNPKYIRVATKRLGRLENSAAQQVLF